jgi:hypothetical protein
MIFQYSPAGFEEYFIENGTLEGMPAKEKTEEEYAERTCALSPGDYYIQASAFLTHHVTL